MTFNIDVVDNKLIFNNDNTFVVTGVEEISSDELSWMLFAPKWSLRANELACEICGGVYDENGKISKGTFVKYITFQNNHDKLEEFYVISFIVSDDGELLLNIGEGVGTYVLTKVE